VPGINDEFTPLHEIQRIAIKQSTTFKDIARYAEYNTSHEYFQWALSRIPRKMLGAKNYSRLRRWLLGDLNNPNKDIFFEPGFKTTPTGYDHSPHPQRSGFY
jgi:hypothetical protein